MEEEEEKDSWVIKFEQEEYGEEYNAPEHRLLQAILTCSLQDALTKHTNHVISWQGGRSVKEKRAALEWFFTDVTHPWEDGFTFLGVCEALDLDPQSIRKKLRSELLARDPEENRARIREAEGMGKTLGD
jgi:hypothetical protein